MSFFNSLQQYVSTGVANLSLTPKRFSLGRDNSSAGNYPDVNSPERIGGSSGRSASSGNVIATGSTNNTAHGFPKVVPTQAAISSFPRARRKTIECPPGPAGLTAPATPRRVGSFRHQRAARAPLVFCRRRQSWPEFDQQATSGVQETDGSFFESFTALTWKQENRRLLIHQDAEVKNEEPTSPPGKPADTEISSRDLEHLYVEVLYTIKNKVGVSTGQYAHYQEELYQYAQEAFNIQPQRHRKLLAVASEEKPPIVVLNVVVVEAENLEAKDANGFSDPYCMLGIQPANAAPPSPQMVREAPLSPRVPASRALSDSGSDLESPKHESSHQEKLRKHHSFKLSFKRRETISGRREGRDSISFAVPAKFIRATSVRSQTLNPTWNEKFKFNIDDLSTDILHLDIWDHDDESSVLDAVSHLNEVRGVKGLGRFFKQIAQSARSGSQDDFLGCVNVSLQGIPSTGLDCWYKLEARTQRSNIQGRIRLKLWLTTKEDRGTSEEDNWSEIHQQEQLHFVFIGHELSKHKGKSWEWSGDLPQVALTIIHQHAIQGDVTDLQLALVRWVAYSKISHERFLDPKILYKLLQDMDQVWATETLSKEEEECLAESFTSFVEYSLYLVRRHRILFPPQQRATMTRFDYLLRCLGLLANMKAFRKCCPFHKEIRGEIILALKKGTAEWYEEAQSEALKHTENREAVLGSQSDFNRVDRSLQALTHLVTVLLVDLQTGIQAFNPLFEHTNNVQYFNAVYKQLEKMINHEMGPRVSQLCAALVTTEESQLAAQNIHFATSVFELYLALQEFVSLKENLNISDQKSLFINNYYQWFEAAVEQWLKVAKIKALYRIKAAFELSRMVSGERIVKHSTSAIDATACFYQIQEFWRQLAWPDLFSAYNYVMTVIDIITSSSLYYSDLVQQKLQDSGYYEDSGQTFKVSDEMCISVNDLEYVRRFLNMVGTSLSVEPILDAVESTDGDNPFQWRDALYGMLEETKLTLEARALQITSKMGTKMRPSLKKVMFHLAWSPDSLPTSEAISPLLELLDGYLVSLNAALLPRNFERSLADIWDTVLLELGHQVDSTSGEKVTGFYDRLYEALDILVDFFHAEEKGLSIKAIKSATYRQVEQRLSYHRTDTEKLISFFYQQRLTDQIGMETSEYGVLSVRAYFNHDSLCVEVLNAKDVIPLDPNGFSDPFVIVELLPRKVFSHCTEQQTNVHKKTLNPMFDECFEFSVTLEQCKSEGAMILFTVMDHDVLTSNDFAGEAFLSLQTIPGVADNSSSIDNFHGLKTQDLNLMHQKNKNHPILQILETRTWDRLAQEFVKKQKLRFATNFQSS